MKGFSLKIIVLLFFSCLSMQLFAQRTRGLAVEGKVSVQEGSVDGAIIKMFRDGVQMDSYGIGSDGKYKVELPYNHKFELIFERKDNFSQKIVVDATLPKTVQQEDPRFPPFPVDITLFTEIPGIDRSFSEKTVLKIYYSPRVDNFISELYYNSAQIKSLIDQAILKSKQLGKEADYLSRLTRAELAELRREYNKLLEDAGKEYSNEKFLAALDGFKAASKIFPNEQFPKDRIAEINDLLGMLMVASELDKAMAERFASLIKEGDQLFNQTRYTDARATYHRALAIRPNDQYALSQVQKISDLLNREMADENYLELIAQGDVAFKEILYNEAIVRYQAALEIKPNEEYPKSQIAEANRILDEQANNLKNQESYKQAIFQAESNFEKQFYEKSIASYENALKYKPGDPAATRRIEEIREIMREITDRILFDQLVKTADKAYRKKQYEVALNDYKEANLLFPEEAHPKERIAEISQMLDLQESFADLVYKADNQFADEDYEGAKSFYTQALQVNAEDSHSQNRIQEIEGILAAKGQENKYQELLTQANTDFEERNYEAAKQNYNAALQIKSKEREPKQRIAEIDRILEQIARTEQQYKQTIAKADGLFNSTNYLEARDAYVEAGKIKPEETYPKERLQNIDQLIVEAAEAEAARLAALEAEKDKNYNDAIARADELFTNESYEESRDAYRAALDVKPEEAYAQQRIDEIGTIMAQLSAAQKAYEEAVAEADREFRQENFDAAIAAYNQAKSAKADEGYPEDQLARIDSIVTTRERLAAEAAAAEAARLAAIQAEKDKNYNDAIARADELFTNESYEESRDAYRAALDVKPKEAYAQQRIDEIGTIMAQLSAAQKAYEEAVAEADREFRQENFDAAIAAYNQAKSAKADEGYPEDQLARIDSIVTTRERLAAEAAAAEAARLAAIQAEKDKNYNDAIARADELFTNESYEESRDAYRAALDVKPEEAYAQQRIDEIGTIMAQLSAAQKAYEEAVAEADREFRQENFDAAIAAYNQAKSAKADEGYPEDQLARIDSIVTTRERLAAEAAAAEAARLAAIQAEKDKNYNDAIARADELFTNESYEESRDAYRAALDVKPEEAYAQQRIDEIGTIMAQLSAAQKAYEEAVAEADREFRQENFDAAIAAYNQAKSAKADEGYPEDQLARIDSIVTTRERLAAEAAAAEAARLAAIQAEKDKNYNDAIARADELFTNESYEESRDAYRAALDVKPEEAYAQQRIDEIGTIMAQLSAAQKAYEEAVAEADREFRRENFDAAIAAYNQAKSAKADEGYPEDQLARIDSIVTTRERLAAEAAAAEAARLAAIQAEKDKNYNDAIARADELFTNESYEESRDAYRAALDVKTEENYPQERITEIDNIVRERTLAKQREDELNRNYADLIQQADRFFGAMNYNPSKEKYNDALALKPEESYPAEKIAEIDRILEEQRINEAYRVIIVAADGHFRGKNYLSAKGEYEKALGVKPEEQYPKDQIARIDQILAEEQAKILAEQQAADDLERRREELAAMQAEIENTNAASSAELNDLYNEFIRKADAFFNDEQYNVSRAWYYQAGDVKPDETYPPERISEINRILAGMYVSQRDRDYQNYINLGDSTLRDNKLAVARGWYNQALNMKPNEVYPRNQINEIQRIISERLAGNAEQQFKDHKSKADKAFDEQVYTLARFWYKKALELKPNDVDVKARLSEIGGLLR